MSAPRLLVGDRLVGPGWLRIMDGVVAEIGQGAPPSPAALVLEDGVLAPGLVDLQLNGAFGHDLADADAQAWHDIATRLPESGVTSFAATLTTAAWDQLLASVSRCAAMHHVGGRAETVGRARSLGLHVEAVFLAPDRRGAHPAEHLAPPTPERVQALLDAAGPALTYVTLAPELVGGLAAVERLVGAGVRVAVGHSDASDEVVRQAVDAGASLVTHLYNGQRPMTHRDPGVVGAALSDPRLTLGLIADLHHVAPTAIRVAFAAARGRIALVTDAIAAMGMPPGTYRLGRQVVHVLPDAPPVREDGALAGSVLRLDEAIANTIGCGIDPTDALIAATRTPADALGREDLGRLAPGAVADLVWLGRDWRARATWVAGELVHGAVPGHDRTSAAASTSHEERA